MVKIMSNPSAMHAIEVLVSTMALMVGALIGCRSTGLEGIAFVAITEFLVGSKNATTYVEASTASRRQSINFMTAARMM
jgi:hypothetical protein